MSSFFNKTNRKEFEFLFGGSLNDLHEEHHRKVNEKRTELNKQIMIETLNSRQEDYVFPTIGVVFKSNDVVEFSTYLKKAPSGKYFIVAIKHDYSFKSINDLLGGSVQSFLNMVYAVVVKELHPLNATYLDEFQGSEEERIKDKPEFRFYFPDPPDESYKEKYEKLKNRVENILTAEDL